MAGNYRGGTHVLAATYTKLSDDSAEARFLTIRNNSGNATVEISPDGIAKSYYIKNSEGREFKHIRPSDIYVKGTAGQSLFWDAT